jgi:hypothetical protein
MHNCVFWSNPVTNLGPSMLNIGAGALPTIDYSILEEVSCPPGATCGGSVLYATDPLFIDLPNCNLRITSTSPAWDAGDLTVLTVPHDLDFNPRILCCGVDLGAYEDTSCTRIIYVNHLAPGLNDGTSWPDAFTDLQDALALAATCPGYKEIWFAEGNYYPTTCAPCSSVDRAMSFSLVDGVEMYGGFDGTEMMREMRHWAAHRTILNGNIGDLGLHTDNTYQIVHATDVGASTILDGFVLSNGFANGTPQNNGAALLINAPGSAALSSPIIRNCEFSFNTATGKGGAIFMATSLGEIDPEIVNCVFFDNQAFDGGALAVNAAGATGHSHPEIINCTFSENHGTNRAGWMLIEGVSGGLSEPQIHNCIIWGNTSGTGLNPNVLNIGAANGFLQFSDISQATCPVSVCGSGMKYLVNPLFVDPGGNDFRVRLISPVIDMGLTSALPPGIIEDLDKLPRVTDGNCDGIFDIDMGAYEVTSYAGDGVLYVDPAATGAEDGSSWSDALTELQPALNFAGAYGCIEEVWVKEGTYFSTTSSDRALSFVPPDGKSVFGGFDGTEVLRSERDWTTHLTILSADIGAVNDSTDNSFHVVRITGILDTTVVDGFIIERGNADHPTNPLHKQGGGIWQDPSMLGTGIVRNCTVRSSFALVSGGGVFNGSDMNLINCTLHTNNAQLKGNAIMNEHVSAHLLIKDCWIQMNGTNPGVTDVESTGSGIMKFEGSTLIEN